MSLLLASWPGVVAVVILALAFAISLRGSTAAARRFAAAFGFAALVPLLLLGAIWPSAFTLAALFALPAAIWLLVGIARPSILRGAAARAYLLVAVLLSPVCLLIETLWLQGGQVEVSKFEVIRSSGLLIVDVGQPLPSGCTQVGTVDIPRRSPGFFARHLGLAEEDFYRALDAQVARVGADLLVPHEGIDLFAASSSGEPFQGTVYSCP